MYNENEPLINKLVCTSRKSLQLSNYTNRKN